MPAFKGKQAMAAEAPSRRELLTRRGVLTQIALTWATKIDAFGGHGGSSTNEALQESDNLKD